MNIVAQYFEDDGSIPNSPFFQTLIYEGALNGNEQETEKVFNENGWLNSWQNGVFDYHHYHSNTHEVLGVISGSAQLQLGGEEGKVFLVKTGDVIILPAGTGHKKIASSSDFKVVGAYPGGSDYDTRTGEIGERPEVMENIKQTKIPASDPVFGISGPLFNYWK
ncbi:cupin domain-containing protein [Fictibacillus iocasae]|uniref:Cupin domain-containing protein n=1 Tax=Fictibacillus iocasae TaxID=2715437 RepID=A0ABW2NNN9_9BACL